MSREFGRRSLRFALAAITIFEAATHVPVTTKNAFHELFSPDPSCPEIVPRFAHYDAIAVFGAGSYIDENGLAHPNTYQMERLKAAASAYVEGFSNEIVLIDDGGGSVYMDSINTLSENVRFLSGGTQSLDPNNVKIIRNSVNTAENAEDLKIFMTENGFTKVLSVSDLFHYKRLRLLIDNYEINGDVSPTECAAANYFKEDIKMLTQRQMTSEMIRMQNKEWWAILELSIDPKGKLSIVLKKVEDFFRGQ